MAGFEVTPEDLGKETIQQSEVATRHPDDRDEGEGSGGFCKAKPSMASLGLSDTARRSPRSARFLRTKRQAHVAGTLKPTGAPFDRDAGGLSHRLQRLILFKVGLEQAEPLHRQVRGLHVPPVPPVLYIIGHSRLK